MSSVFTTDLLKSRVALITGGGTGICRGIALAFAAHGCDVAIVSRKLEHLEPTAVDLRALGVRAVARAADVRDPVAVIDAITAVVSELGRLDILINGAAGNSPFGGSGGSDPFVGGGGADAFGTVVAKGNPT